MLANIALGNTSNHYRAPQTHAGRGAHWGAAAWSICVAPRFKFQPALESRLHNTSALAPSPPPCARPPLVPDDPILVQPRKPFSHSPDFHITLPMPTSLNQPSSTPTVRHPKRALRTSNARGPSGPEAEQSFLEDPSDDEQEDDAVPSRPAVPAFRWRKPPPLLVSDSIFSHTKAALPAHAADARSITNECTPKLGPQPAAAAAAASSTSKPTSPPLVKLNLVSNAEAETLVGRGSIAPNPLRESIDYHVQLAEQLARFGLAGKRKSHGPLVWSNDDLEFIHDLGAGNGGTVAKVRHGPTNQVMAKKTVFIDAQPGVRKQILRELQIMHECCHPCIIGFYGAYQNEPFHICMCMEYMDKGYAPSPVLHLFRILTTFGAHWIRFTSIEAPYPTPSAHGLRAL